VTQPNTIFNTKLLIGSVDGRRYTRTPLS
jgi:hypothetical protein